MKRNSRLSRFKQIALALVCSFLAPGISSLMAQTDPFLVPAPEKMEAQPGEFNLSQVSIMEPKFGFSLLKTWLLQQPTTKVWSKKSAPSKLYRPIRYKSDPSIPLEGYALEISPAQVLIAASTPAGFLYAEQSVIQLAEQRKGLCLPCVKISDSPRFSWRGMHLDESRHFMGKTFVKKYIDWLCALKMNVFHWHLTDAPGWRIEIKKYPKLTEIGAWRPDRTGLLFGEADTAKVGEAMTYGGFYSQDDIREVVAYAAERNITIIPEIEMPGHTTAALVAYPEYSCTGGPFPMPGGAKNCVYPNFCVGNEKTYTFLEDILSEVMALFPSTYIHIGGDEVEREQWTKCSKCQALKVAQQLENEAQLQVYFTKRVEQFIQSKGRKLMGWDEIMEGENLSTSAGVMVWRGEDQARKATLRGNSVVITHNYYFDLYQGNPAYEPVTYGYLPLEKVYTYEPLPPDFSLEQQSHILGVQGCLWTENVYDVTKAEYMLFPRLFALAEVAWTRPPNKNWQQFQQKIIWCMEWMNQRSTHYATSVFDPEIQMIPAEDAFAMQCELVQQIPFGALRYTMDGTEPDTNARLYTRPIDLTQPCEVKTAVFLPSGQKGNTRSVQFYPTLATGQKFELRHLPDVRYNGQKPHILTDGLSGSMAFHDGRWCGFYGNDFDWSIHFSKVETPRKLQINFLDATRSWIYLPENISIETSVDGLQWRTVAEVTKAEMSAITDEAIKPVSIPLNGDPVQHVRIFAKNKGMHPVYPDGQCWLFVDEIRIE